MACDTCCMHYFFFCIRRLFEFLHGALLDVIGEEHFTVRTFGSFDWNWKVIITNTVYFILLSAFTSTFSIYNFQHNIDDSLDDFAGNGRQEFGDGVVYFGDVFGQEFADVLAQFVVVQQSLDIELKKKKSFQRWNRGMRRWQHWIFFSFVLKCNI